MKKHFTVLASIAFILSACGETSSKNNQNINSDNNSLIGYYQDSGIVGVEYKCGKYSGVTSDKGQFKFENGKNCEFSFAGILLRKIDSSELKENVVVREEDLETALFLQSLDDNGNPDDGIQISKDTIQKIKDALSSNNLNKQDVLNDINKTKQLVEDAGYTLKSLSEVKQHLNKTYEDYIKSLLGGYKLYAVSIGVDSNIEEVSFNKDLTQLTIPDEIIDISIQDGKIVTSDNNVIEFKIMKNYIDVPIFNKRLYFTKKDAQDYINNIKSNAIKYQDLEEQRLTSAPVYYQMYNDLDQDGVKDHVVYVKQIFNSNGTTKLEFIRKDLSSGTMTTKQIYNTTWGKTSDGKLYFVDGGTTHYGTVIDQTDTSMTYKTDKGKIAIFYFYKPYYFPAEL